MSHTARATNSARPRRRRRLRDDVGDFDSSERTRRGNAEKPRGADSPAVDLMDMLFVDDEGLPAPLEVILPPRGLLFSGYARDFRELMEVSAHIGPCAASKVTHTP